MDYSPLEKIIQITDNPAEMAVIGLKIKAALPTLYTPLMMEKMYEGIERHIPNASPEKKEEMVYRSIYDYFVYGTNIDEEFYYHFDKKTHQEKQQYLCGHLRGIYVTHLNKDGKMTQLSYKYRLYQRLKPYYLREMISISNENDFQTFRDFASRHDVFVVKPINFWYGLGVHKASLQDYGGDVRTAFDSILNEGKTLQGRHPSRDAQMVLAELIDQDPAMAQLHPESVNALRITMVRGADGKATMFHPFIKIGMNGDFIASAAQNGVVADIDPETGILCTDGYNETGKRFMNHPNTGIKIKGFQIPRWDELLELVGALGKEMREFGYIGWDLVLSKRGWCVMEGNYSGEQISQIILEKGLRGELEELIGWKYEKEYWWQESFSN